MQKGGFVPAQLNKCYLTHKITSVVSGNEFKRRTDREMARIMVGKKPHMYDTGRRHIRTKTTG